jgi:hypothetical protein
VNALTNGECTGSLARCVPRHLFNPLLPAFVSAHTLSLFHPPTRLIFTPLCQALGNLQTSNAAKPNNKET